MNWLALFDPWVSGRVCLTLLHSLWQVPLLAIITLGIERIRRRESVEWSYVLHVTALVFSLVALPLTYMSVQIPRVRGPQIAAPTLASVSANIAPFTGPLSPPPGLEVHPDSRISTRDGVNDDVKAASEFEVPSMAYWLRLTPWLVLGYISGTLLMLIRLVVGIIRVERLRSLATPIVDGPLVDSLRKLSKSWSMRVAPLLAQAEKIFVPKVIGWFRPTILLPAAAITGLSTSELEMILAHELAHVRRYDMWINLLQRLAEVVLFFNPGLWYLSRRIGTLREYCCDELTCRQMFASNAEPRLRYATALLRIVELSNASAFSHSQLTALAASGRSPSELRRRVARLFGEPLREPLPFSRSGVLLLAVVAAAAVCGPTMWVSRAQSTGDAAPPNQSNKTADTKDIKSFSPVGKTEIVAIGTHRETPQRWWDERGKINETVPFTWKHRESVSSDDIVWRRIVYRIRDLPDDAVVNSQIVGAHASAEANINLDGQDKPKGYFADYFGTDDKQKVVTLRIGVAAGPWKTEAEIGLDMEATGRRNNKSLVSSGAFATKDGTVVVISHNYFDMNCRVAAVDKHGITHKSTITGGASSGPISQTRPTFPDLKPADVDHFEFQVRDYKWVTLKDLPLNPAKSTPGNGSDAKRRKPERQSSRASDKGNADQTLEQRKVIQSDESLDIGEVKVTPSEKAKPASADQSGPVLRGRITDEQGKPIADVQVVLYGGVATRFHGQEAKTDANGEYRFDPLKTGAGIYVEKNGSSNYYTGVKFEHPAYVPADGKSWREIEVPSKKEHVEVLDLKMTRGGKVQGVVVNDETGEPIPKLDLRIHNGFLRARDDGSFLVYATTDANGTFLSDPLFPGTYVVEINDNKYDINNRYRKIGKVVAREGETAELRMTTRELPELQDPFQITGTAVGDDGKSMVYGGVRILMEGSDNKLRTRGGGIDGRNVFDLAFGPIERGKVSDDMPYGIGTHDIELFGNNGRFGYKLVKRTPAELLRITDDPRKPEVENGIRYIRPNHPVEFKLVFTKVKADAAEKDAPPK